MKEIRLSRSNSGYNATFLDEEGKPDAEIVALFGTHTIPTAFTYHALEVDVVATLARLNPSYAIIDTFNRSNQERGF